MEEKWKTWYFGDNKKRKRTTGTYTIKDYFAMLRENVIDDNKDQKIQSQMPGSSIHLGLANFSSFPFFRTSSVVEDAVVEAIRSAKFNSYSLGVGILPARRAIAEYLSRDLPYKLLPDDVYITVGCKDAIETILTILARPGANILLPRPCYPRYVGEANFCNLEVRYFNMLPEKSWEVDLDALKVVADENTIALVIIDPGNPCSNVYSYQHLKNVAETAKVLMIPMIADEVYSHIVYGSNPFVPMGVFGSTVPIITLGSISKSWMVPGWRLVWLVTVIQPGFSKKLGLLSQSRATFPYQIAESIKSHLSISSRPATFIQGSIPKILEKTPEDFFSRINCILKEASEICCNRIKEIPCITLPYKPQGSMFLMVKLNLSLLEDIADDVEFFLKLAKEDSVIVLPGGIMGMKDWFRIYFGTEHSFLEDGFSSIKAFCQRHAKVK